MIPLPPTHIQEAPVAVPPKPFPGPGETLRSPDGRWVVLHLVRHSRQDAHLRAPHELILLDLKTGTSLRFLACARSADACFSPDGRHLLVTEWTGPDSAAVRLYRLEEGLKAIPLEPWLKAYSGPASFQALGWVDAQTLRLQRWGYTENAERKAFRQGLDLSLEGGVKEVYPKGE